MVGYYNTALAVVYEIEMCKVFTKLDCATSSNHTPTHKHIRSTRTQCYHSSMIGDDMCYLKDYVSRTREKQMKNCYKKCVAQELKCLKIVRVLIPGMQVEGWVETEISPRSHKVSAPYGSL